MDIHALYSHFLDSTGVSTDSRKTVAGSVFFALSGPRFDGNAFAKNALKDGASIAVIDNAQYREGNQTILVEDCLTALQMLASHHRKKMPARVVALTGSNGKTTTKELLQAVLQSRFNTQSTRGNLNNHIGVPLTLLELRPDTDFLVLEMGANHVGEIADLCNIGLPDYGMITNIGKAHLEGFGGIEGVKKGKSELYRHLADHGQTIFVNADDDVLCSLLPAEAKTLEYRSSAFSVRSLEPGLTVEYRDRLCPTELVGTYNLDNIAAAWAIGQYFGIPDDDICVALSSYKPSNNRSEATEYKNFRLIRDAYNANPTSMMKSLESFFSRPASENLCVVLGDMLELGEYAEEEHLKILQYVDRKDSRVILIGPEFLRHRTRYPEFTFYESIHEVDATTLHEELAGRMVLIKGSRGIGLEKLFG